MHLNVGPVLTLAEARGFIRRAIDKAEDLSARGAFVVVNDGGIPISASRMDGAGLFSLPVSRAKAYVAAATREPSAEYAALQSRMFLGIFLANQGIVRDKIFPGYGAFVVRRDGHVVGGISTGAGIGPFVKWPGLADPQKLVVEGKPTNLEDLVISYALNEPYQAQHGDDLKRWMDVYGASPSGPGSGLLEAPRARNQHALAGALTLADLALAEASRRGVAVGVAIVDRNGDLVQLDRMEGAAPMAADAAEAVAVTAVNWRMKSGVVGDAGDLARMAHIGAAVPFKFLPVAGGIPVSSGGAVIGGLGVSGAAPALCEEIAEAALAQSPT